MNTPESQPERQLSDSQRLAWLRLIRSENVGPATFKNLLDHFGSAERALERLPDLSRRGGGKTYRLCPAESAEAELAAHAKHGSRLVALGEPDYPPHLAHIHGPPPLLSIKGHAVTARSDMLAIVGARNASLSGRKLAAMFARDLGQAGFAIASGLARGIDAAAHEAALQNGTVAVLAGGIDNLYPPEHGRLLAAILDSGGAVVSEMPFGWKPRGRDFPRRNRIISGVSLGTIVIEAAKSSGSLHTARYALEQNRDIFAVPGSPLDPRSEGANDLIRQGAMLVAKAADVVEGLGARRAPADMLQPGLFEQGEAAPTPVHEPDEMLRDKVLSALGPTPLDVDELARFVEADIRSLNVLLLELELAGRLERHAGNKISQLF